MHQRPLMLITAPRLGTTFLGLHVEILDNQKSKKVFEQRKKDRMMNEYEENRGMSPLLKSFLLVLVFGIVAMPFVGLFLILRRESGTIKRLIGIILLLVAIATWSYLAYYSIH